jgi:hypothetical protein
MDARTAERDAGAATYDDDIGDGDNDQFDMNFDRGSWYCRIDSIVTRQRSRKAKWFGTPGASSSRIFRLAFWIVLRVQYKSKGYPIASP